MHIDGHQVHIAHLRREGKRIVLVGLDSATLPSRLDLQPEEEEVQSVTVDTGDILGLTVEEPVEIAEVPAQDEGAEEEEEEEEGEPETNADVLFRLLEKYPLKRCSLALSLLETGVFFRDFADDFGLKGKKLKDKLVEELIKERSFDGTLPLAERQAFFPIARGGLLSVAHEDPLEVLGLLDSLKPFIGRVQIGLIEPLEITLMNLVRLSYPPAQYATAVVFVGEGFSRAVFMCNGEYQAFSQPIHEGFQSPQILNTLYSRILFEQDVSELPEIGQVLLVGSCQAIDALPFFTEQFPDARVEYLAFPDLDLESLEEQEREWISSFAIPIGLAWKNLRPRQEQFYPVNFLPRERKRQQNPLELAWHGLVLFALLAVSVLFFGVRVQNQGREIDDLALAVELLEKQVQENMPHVQKVDEIHAQIGDYERNFSLIDTLASQQESWSTRLGEISKALRRSDGLWLDRLSTLEGGVDTQGEWGGHPLPAPERIFVDGKAAQRTWVSKIAHSLGDGDVRSVTRTKLRDRTIYRFDLTLPITSSTTEP